MAVNDEGTSCIRANNMSTCNGSSELQALRSWVELGLLLFLFTILKWLRVLVFFETGF
jgi:hypothetical protein